MTVPLLHIGYPKTGTTWLQRHVFPSAAMGFGILGRKLVKNEVVYLRALDFDSAMCRAELQPAIEMIADQQLVPVLSVERLSGDPHAGGYDSKEMADRLHACFPHGKVLIVIREQRSMLLSLYRQYVQAGGPARLRDYLVPTDDPEQRRMHGFDLDHFKYHRLAGYYVRLFGRGNVLVLPFELLKDQPAGFVEAITRFAGARPQPAAIDNLPFGKRENEGKSPLVVGLKRWLNVLCIKGPINPWTFWPIPRANQYWRRSLGWRLDALLPRWLASVGEERARRTIREIVGTRFSESNALTAQYVNADLARFGYELPAHEAAEERSKQAA